MELGPDGGAYTEFLDADFKLAQPLLLQAFG